MVVFPVLFLLGSLIPCGRGQTEPSRIDLLREAARKPHKLLCIMCSHRKWAHISCSWFRLSCLWMNIHWQYKHVRLQFPLSLFFCPIPVNHQGELKCGNWDCDCIFKGHRGCCCGANELYQLEDNSFKRVTNLWTNLFELNSRVTEVTGEHTDISKFTKIRALSFVVQLICPSLLSQVTSRLPLRHF